MTTWYLLLRCLAGTILTASAGACQLFGMSDSVSISGRGLDSLLLGADTLADSLAAAMRGEPQARSFDARHRSGTVRTRADLPERSPRAHNPHVLDLLFIA